MWKHPAFQVSNSATETMTTTTSKDLNAQVLATYYDFGSKNSHITIPQLEFRIEVVKQWGIPMGSRVLDIGCGQVGKSHQYS